MFESLTYDFILAKEKAKVPENVSSAEGSLVHDALAPAAAELQEMYIGMDYYYDQIFADTADRESLLRIAAIDGITPKEATAAVWSAQILPASTVLQAGTRFNAGTLNLYISDSLGGGKYTMTCETAGTKGNNLPKSIVPIDYISYTSATLLSIMTPGTDEEDTEDFRARYLSYLQHPATSGNKYSYYNWAMEVEGVAAAKVFPLLNGNGTVGVTIAATGMKAASETLVKAVQTHIDRERPIGASVTVKSAEELSVSIEATVTLADGAALSDVQKNFAEKVEAYLHDSAFKIKHVGLARIGDILINLSGVSDYSSIKLNGSAANVTLTDDQIAVAGAITLTEE
ncbi:MAG: baseplate J/gp47 family protein [Lachnospiraceae bacterium]|nr:baseplate J/gp47 family protein [Lachnospiraceae bacterium]